jgi:hypothetical protein
MVAKDFANIGISDPILIMKFIDGYFPIISRNEFLRTFTQKNLIYDSYEKYARTTAADILKDLGSGDAISLEAKYLNNCILMHYAGDSIAIESLPLKGQLAPIFGTLGTDINSDRKTDFLLVGNFYSSNISQGPYCAFTGGLLSSDSSNNLSVSSGHENGFYVHNDAKALASLILGSGEKIFLVTSNNDSLKVFSQLIQKEDQIKLGPLDSYAIIEWTDGNCQRQEFYYGSGYMSQSSRFLSLTPGWEKVKIVTYSGEERTITLKDYLYGRPIQDLNSHNR